MKSESKLDYRTGLEQRAKEYAIAAEHEMALEQERTKAASITAISPHDRSYAFVFDTKESLRSAVSILFRDPDLKGLQRKGNGEPNTLVIPEAALALFKRKLKEGKVAFAHRKIPTSADFPRSVRKGASGLFY